MDTDNKDNKVRKKSAFSRHVRNQDDLKVLLWFLDFWSCHLFIKSLSIKFT